MPLLAFVHAFDDLVDTEPEPAELEFDAEAEAEAEFETRLEAFAHSMQSCQRMDSS